MCIRDSLWDGRGREWPHNCCNLRDWSTCFSSPFHCYSPPRPQIRCHLCQDSLSPFDCLVLTFWQYTYDWASPITLQFCVLNELVCLKRVRLVWFTGSWCNTCFFLESHGNAAESSFITDQFLSLIVLLVVYPPHLFGIILVTLTNLHLTKGFPKC